jgi:tetratricopeptide (TPR) repeat protein
MLGHATTRLALLLGVAVFLTGPLAPRMARAADPPAPDAASLEEAKRRFAEGQRLFERGELKPAVEEFKEAFRLTRNPLLLYNIGFVYDRLGDEPLALHYYTKFVDEAQDDARTHDQLREASARAAALRAKLDLDPPTPATQPTAPEPSLDELAHDLIDQAPPGQPIDVTVRMPRNALWTVTLHYRAPGQDLYQSVKMKARAGAPAATAAAGEERASSRWSHRT